MGDWCLLGVPTAWVLPPSSQTHVTFPPPREGQKREGRGESCGEVGALAGAGSGGEFSVIKRLPRQSCGSVTRTASSLTQLAAPCVCLRWVVEGAEDQHRGCRLLATPGAPSLCASARKLPGRALPVSPVESHPQ